MYCKMCGNQFSKSIICPNCGTPVDGEIHYDSDPIHFETNIKVQPKQEVKPSKMVTYLKFVYLIISTVVCIGLIFIIYWYFSDREHCWTFTGYWEESADSENCVSIEFEEDECVLKNWTQGDSASCIVTELSNRDYAVLHSSDLDEVIYLELDGDELQIISKTKSVTLKQTDK